MMRHFGLVMLAGLFVLTIIIAIPTVQGLDGDIYTLESDTYVTFDRNFKNGDQLSFAFETGNSTRIDVFAVDDLNYELYKDGLSFDYSTTGTFLNESEGSAIIDFTEKDYYYIIFDNTDAGDASPPTVNNGTVIVEAEITVYISSPSQPPPGADIEVTGSSDPYYYWPGYILVIILVILIIVIILLVRSGDDYLDYQ